MNTLSKNEGKLVAKNHQFLGVNNAIAAVGRLHENRGKLGVFWHTQGSGKSYSMVFFSQKVLRKIPGNWTFVIVTDREDLDGQIYRNFANTGALLEDEKRVRAESAVGLRRMLNEEDHRYVSTLIQKCRTEHGERYPVLSTRSDIIVITDEAHRSQYDIFAANMRSALPNAAFIGFTGTPLMAGEERKPMKNHTLMQTIARANRVFRDKQNGLIVDYVGVFRNLQKALAIYGAPQDDGGPGDTPIHDKSELVRQLREAISNATAFCLERGIAPAAIRDARGFEREKLKEDAVAAFVVNDETRRQYLNLAGAVRSLFKSLLPDASAYEFGPICNVFKVVAEKIRSELPAVDIAAVMAEVEALLNRSIAADGYVMPAVANDPSRYIDLSQVDFEALREKFEKGRKAIEVQKLRAKIAVKLAQMVKLNRTRIDFLEEFQRMIDEYNAGSANVETFFAKLMAFTKRLNDEEKRGLAEQLTEEELVIFDLLTKPDIKLTNQETAEVAANELFDALMGLWNALATHQSESTPFRLTRIATQAEPEDLRRLCQIRIDELEGFIDGLFGDEEAIELPERAHEALEHLREINAMLHGIVELLGRQPAPPASADDVAGTLRNVRELSRIAEQELHAVVLVCTRARQHRLATSAVTKPTIH